MDLTTPLTAGLIAYASKDMLAKLLGPTFDYLGEGLKFFVEKRCNNVMSIFEKASKKLDDKINEDGIVSPRVLKHILGEGSFCEDNLTQEYFAGLLASSRTATDENIHGDDKSLPYLSLVEQMSAQNILFHYAIYYSFVTKIFRENNINFFSGNDVSKHIVCFQYATVVQMFGDSDFPVLMSDVCSHAYKEDIIQKYSFGNFDDSKIIPRNDLNKDIITPELESSVLRVCPTLFGLMLFLKANAAPRGILWPSPLEERMIWVDRLENKSNLEPMPIVLSQK
jgi:hypothetical protein